ncbi:MAG: hypothetical protein CFH34_00750 [Alphaproteobacteria bacterium MarineAlpha9_Bin4]|nr:hypothetical protein [Pelagibacterales bacterium]PPR26728.1 MAG: hypothetical protein CFH34_00750 [Alphaproteobacteria bacterium MarineAlpha9_Bin4]|tara:strand:- start:232 stop:663 length:432 start_codon:yes stop_codon:yes gene_type:complete
MLNINKRNFLFCCCALPFYYNTNILSSQDKFDYLLKGPLAGSLYYTKKKPGRWKKMLSSHIPVIQRKSNFLEVSTPHEMRGFEHFIIKHTILDKKFNIISEKKFDPSKDRAYSKHNIAGFSETLFVMSVCNLHDTWLEPVRLF